MFSVINFTELMWKKIIFPVIYLKAMHLTGQNDRPNESLSGQMTNLAGHRILTSHYFERWESSTWSEN